MFGVRVDGSTAGVFQFSSVPAYRTERLFQFSFMTPVSETGFWKMRWNEPVESRPVVGGLVSVCVVFIGLVESDVNFQKMPISIY